ncbi:hypothetical protein MMB232_00043 [Brevundimonas subvibrioides]|uniref:hypothetical protein n=1 Tax=Brevundimonas subvibrioides TaxID=74313 RepID=UPI0032D58B95
MRASVPSLAALTLAGVVCSACASDPGPGGGLLGPGPLAGGPGLFVSPFGELFASEPGQPWPVGQWFAKADANGDGRLTGVEFVADGQSVFRALDLRPDNRLTPDEIVLYERGLDAARATIPGFEGQGGPVGRPGAGYGGMALNGGAQEIESRIPPTPVRGPRAPRGPLAYGPIAAAGFFNYPQPIKAADTDTNQTVTAQEWSLATDRWFLALDTDRDGVLTLATLPRTPLQGLVER